MCWLVSRSVSTQQLKKLRDVPPITIGNSEIVQVNCVKNIGAYLDCNLNMSSHVNNTCRSCYIHLRNLGKIRPFLSTESTCALVHAFISSKLDNLNSLLYGIPEYLVKRLQLIQNNAARIVSLKKKHEHITPVLEALHWLPVKARIHYKICLLTFKGLHGLAPGYLCDLLVPYTPTRSLRSSDRGLLLVRKMHLKRTGDRAFVHAAAVIWNNLPQNLRDCDNLESFKSLLKTYLFREEYF